MDKHAQKLAQDVLDMGSRYLEGKIGLEEFQLFLEGSFSAMEGIDITTKKFLRETR